MFDAILRDDVIFHSEAFLRDELSLNMLPSILKDTEKYPAPNVFSNHRNCVVLNSDPLHGLVVWTDDFFNEWDALFDFVKEKFSNIPQTIVSKKSVYDAAVQAKFASKEDPLILGAYKLNKLNDIHYFGYSSLPTRKDFDEIVEMIKLFEKDTGIEEHHIEEKAESHIKNQNAHLFRNEQGKIVAFGTFALTDDYGRVGCVVVKTEERSKGYGKMLVHSLAKRIIELHKTPMIYTDFNYPASNKCYQAVGFELQNKVVSFSYQK